MDSADFRAEIRKSLLRKPDMPEYEPGKGHWITYWELKNGVDGKYFNIQIPYWIFLVVLERMKEDFFSGYSLPYRLKSEVPLDDEDKDWDFLSSYININTH